MFARLAFTRSIHTTPRLFSATETIEASLRNALKAAMKSKDKPAAACLKSILADVTNAAKSGPNPNEPATQESIISVLRKGLTQRTQAAESYAPSSPSAHPENYASLTKEIALIRSFLPAAPSEEAVQAAVTKIIQALPEDVRSSKGAAGKVLQTLWEELGDGKAAVDKKAVGKWVQDSLKK
ncbi:hypothetical protein L202_02928 [Cryptococcus amylolentus CBS 6039]|uniref:Altered inheritance of mitochondria protein 41 n=1 Tax=Cryptococcus amylolentus CBS 6039 TaxID=1295533 RepID=A0A1E3HWV4_9TREE|nr:hypothetical protein L202_02928 [Cryptococcus amylolentus CBS 6039]ODN80777.1 hypothetical protein L202_02928 [Cryptococcus amylolentus CBS 6039]